MPYLLLLIEIIFSASLPGKCAYAEAAMTPSVKSASKSAQVLPGVDVLASENFVPLAGMRVALLTNQSARDVEGRRTIDVLASAPAVHLISIFTPEHGLGADQEGTIESGRDTQTGLPVYSLYGTSRRPEDASLTGIDAIVIDLQDVGVRFYTYATTMAYAMEAAAQRRLKVIVLDRPNPISPSGVRGPMLEAELRSFVGYFPMPVQHGMTLGELARLFDGENHIGAGLTIIAIKGYKRDKWFDETGLTWRNPSPNLRALNQAILYPGVALVEGTNVSVGRGTATPFELVGAPWIDGPALSKYLENRHVPGIRFSLADFVPSSDKYTKERCYGVRIALLDRTLIDAPLLGIEIGSALHKLFPQEFSVADMLPLVGSHTAIAAIEAGDDPVAIASTWQKSIQDFVMMRSKYLLY